MTPEKFAESLSTSKEFFDRSTRCLTEELAGFQPTPDMMTVAQQVAHVAQTFDWFIEGAFHRADGFDMDFENHMRPVMAIGSLAEARAWLDKAVASAIAEIKAKSIEELQAPLPDGPVMGGAPKLCIIGAIEEHTAHHRGALTVYARLNGLVPAMPYMDM